MTKAYKTNTQKQISKNLTHGSEEIEILNSHTQDLDRYVTSILCKTEALDNFMKHRKTCT